MRGRMRSPSSAVFFKILAWMTCQSITVSIRPRSS